MILRDENGNRKEQNFIDQDGGYVAIVNVEKINGNALLEIQTDDGAFESLLISKMM